MRARRTRTQISALAMVLSVATMLAGCASHASADPSTPAAIATTSAAGPSEPVLVLPDTDPAKLALSASDAFFRGSRAVVLAAADDEAAQRTGAAVAVAVSSPLLLAGGDVSAQRLRSEVRRLRATTIVDVTDGYAASAQEAATNGPPSADKILLDMPGKEHVHVDADAYDAKMGGLDDRTQDLLQPLADARDAEPALTEALALTDGATGQTAAIATARAAGAWPVSVPGGDPRSSEAIVSEIASAQALAVVGIGASFGDAETLTWRVRAAQTGKQLPGGGQLVLPGKRYAVVTAQGSSPYAWAAGKAASGSAEDAAAHLIEQAKEAAAADAQEVRSDFVPAIELPVTVWNPGTMRTGAAVETDDLETVVDAAQRAGVYVIVRFEPGTSTFGEQLVQATALIDRPGVGVALDVDARSAEGSAVDTAELNAAIAAVDKQVQDKQLPQKLVVVQMSDPREVSDLSSLRAGDGQVALAVESTATGSAVTLPARWSALREAGPGGAGWGFEVSARLAADPTLWNGLEPAPVYLAVRP